MPGPVTGGNASKIFTDGTALLAGLADYPGQICTSADGVAWTVARSTGAGGTHGAVVNLNDVISFKEIRPTTLQAVAIADGGIVAAAHLLSATGGTLLDNTVVLGNETGGFAAATLRKTGAGQDYPIATFGTSGAVTSSEYNGLYVATNSPNAGVIDPVPIGLYQEQYGRGTHRRLYCTYGTSGTTTCYGYDAAGAVTGILVADPIAWQVNATGEMGVGGVPEAGKALKVTGNVKFTGSISGDGSGLTGVSATGALVLKGSTDCSGTPNYPSAVKGDTYIVSVAGKIGGASGKVVEVGDLFIASADNAGGTQAGVGASWVIQQTNIDLTNIAITGGTITGTTISGSTGSFTTLAASGAVTFTANTTSTTTGTGTLVVTGGIGVSGQITGGAAIKTTSDSGFVGSGGSITFNGAQTRVIIGTDYANLTLRRSGESGGSSDFGGPVLASGLLTCAAGVKTRTTSASYANVGGAIFDDFTDTSTTHTDGTEDDLYSHTLVASTLGTNGDKVTQEEHVQFVSSATAARRLKKYFGGTLIFDSGSLTLSLGGDFYLRTVVIRASATVVRCTVAVTSTSASSVPYAKYTEVTGLTLSNTQVLKTTGIASGTGAASADIVNKLSSVVWLPAAS